MMRRLACLLILLLISPIAGAGTELRILALQHRFGEELVEAIRPLAGPQGTVSAIDNKLIIQAAPERMPEIERAVTALDTERRMLRIHVQREAAGQTSGGHLSVEGGIRRGDVRIQRPDAPREGVVIEAERQSRTWDSRLSEQLRIVEGGYGVLTVGQSVPVTERWIALAGRYAALIETTRYRDITTGFSVRPRLLGTAVELQIAPRVSSLDQRKVIDLEELATTVRIAPGQWVDLSAVMYAHDEVSRAILSQGAESGEGGSVVRVLVE